MKRGEIWTIAGGGDFTGKPRPVIILQDDQFEDLDSVTVCACTSDPAELPIFRVLIQPSPENGLKVPTHVLVDKIVTVYRSRLGERIGRLEASEMAALGRAVLVFLGFAANAPQPIRPST